MEKLGHIYELKDDCFIDGCDYTCFVCTNIADHVYVLAPIYNGTTLKNLELYINEKNVEVKFNYSPMNFFDVGL